MAVSTRAASGKTGRVQRQRRDGCIPAVEQLTEVDEADHVVQVAVGGDGRS